MSPARTVRLVAAREISTRARSKAFVWTTAVVLVLIVAGSALIGFLGDKEPEPLHVLVTDDALPDTARAAVHDAGVHLTLVPTTKEAR